jgi:hypothetical protein
MAGASAERQETGVVNAVKKAVSQNKKQPITVVSGGVKIANVIEAKKFQGRQASGSEPYTDVIFVTQGSRNYNLSLKGEAAPSLAGGGLRGLEAIVPGIAGRFMKAAHRKLVAMGVESGDKVPDVYGMITQQYKEKIVIGNRMMGGPIDYMYIGAMEVKYFFDDKKGILTFTNANIIPAITFARKYDLYFRLRARREDQTFAPDVYQAGIPKIYGVSPSRGDSAGRIVVTNSVPRNAIIVRV